MSLENDFELYFASSLEIHLFATAALKDTETKKLIRGSYM